MDTFCCIITLASVATLLQNASATPSDCPDNLDSYRRMSSKCDKYLDCSEAVDTSPLDDTLLNDSQLRRCTGVSSTTHKTNCPPSGFHSGTSWSNIPRNCAFCFKIVMTRWNTWPASKGKACTRKRRDDQWYNEYPLDQWYDEYPHERDPSTAVIRVPYGTDTIVTAEKIGPDPVTVHYMYNLIDDSQHVPIILDGKGGDGVIKFKMGYDKAAVKFPRIISEIEMELFKPTYGIIGAPGKLRIVPK